MKPEVDLLGVDDGVKSSGDVLSGDKDLTQEMGKNVDDRLVCFHLGALSLKYFGFSDEEEKERERFYKDVEGSIFTKKIRGRFVKFFGTLTLFSLGLFSFMFYCYSQQYSDVMKVLFLSIASIVVFMLFLWIVSTEVKFVSCFSNKYLERYDFVGGSSSSFLRSLKIELDKDLNADDVSAYLSWVGAMVTRVDNFYKFPRDINLVGSFKNGSFKLRDYYMSKSISRLLEELSLAEKSFTEYSAVLSGKASYVTKVETEMSLKKSLLTLSTRYGVFIRTLLAREDNPYKDIMIDAVANHTQKRDVELNDREQVKKKEMIKQTIKNNEKLLNLIGGLDK